MTETCPILPETVDERAARIGAGLALLVTAGAIVTGAAWVAFLLALDFALRSRGLVAFSPIAQGAKALRRFAGLAPLPTNAGPKRFAALVGVLFAGGIGVALRLHHPRTALAVAGILALCAALEAFLGYCVGCKVYQLLQQAPWKRSHALDPR